MCFHFGRRSEEGSVLTVSTLKPMVGMVVTTSPSFSLYKMVVLPAASRPTIRIRMSFLPKNLVKSFEMLRPMVGSVHGSTKTLSKSRKNKNTQDARER